MLANSGAAGHRKRGGEWNAITDRSFKILGGPISKGSVGILERASENQAATEIVCSVEFVFCVFGIAKIAWIAIGYDAHTDRATVCGNIGHCGSEHCANEYPGRHVFHHRYSANALP